MPAGMELFPELCAGIPSTSRCGPDAPFPIFLAVCEADRVSCLMNHSYVRITGESNVNARSVGVITRALSDRGASRWGRGSCCGAGVGIIWYCGQASQ